MGLIKKGYYARTTNCTLQDLRSPLDERAKSILSFGEKISLCFQTELKIPSMLWMFYANILTSERVISASVSRPGLFAGSPEVSVSVLPHDQISGQDIEETKEDFWINVPRYWTLNIHGATNDSRIGLVFGSNEQASMFFNEVGATIRKKPPLNNADLTAKLEKLAALFDAKKITRKEYNTAKRKLLS